jgi:hypothetical protein
MNNKASMVPIINSFTFDASTTTLTQEVQENGWAQVIKVDVPAFTNAITATVTITDRNGYTVFVSTALAKGAVAAIGDLITAGEVGGVPMDYRYTVNVTLSGAAGGAGGAVKVMMYLKK